jgi:hypothetical protein
VYGYQPWLLAPEAGVRALLRESINLCGVPMQRALERVHGSLLEASRLTMARLAADLEGLPPALAELLLGRAEAAVASWHRETDAQLRRLLAAEAEFPTPERLARLKAQLAARLQHTAAQQRVAAAAAATGGPVSVGQAAVGKEAVVLEGKAAAPPPLNEYWMGWLDKLNR